jgi:hypothetical protein
VRKAQYAHDRYLPIYHYVSPKGQGDPNGLCFWRGRWHLFYQAYPPEDPRQHWGHAVRFRRGNAHVVKDSVPIGSKQIEGTEDEDKSN